MQKKICVLGIDPGSHYTGYGIVEWQAGSVRHVTHGVIHAKMSNFGERLNFIHSELSAIVGQFGPAVAAIESIFLGRNADSAFKLGHARGVCLQVLASHNISVLEYATRLVKKGVTGSGGASKEQVQVFLRALLGLRENIALDASDALAVAIYQARQLDLARLKVREGTL